MRIKVDPTAIIHPTAELEEGVEVGPYSIIGASVKVGRDTKIASHVVIDDWTTIGEGNDIYPFVSIGAPPQDLGYRGEKTEVVIGNNNSIREFVTIHRSTTKENCKTICGNDNLFMNYVHIAHDCVLGDGIIMANAATLAGHVRIDDHAIVGGLVAIHQYARIGAHCIIGGCSAVSKDIPPFVLAVGNRAHLLGLNRVGLRRGGFSREEINDIKTAYNRLFKSGMVLSDAVASLDEMSGSSPHVRKLIDFIGDSKRGITKERLKVKVDHIDEKSM